ncbi:hypothetical protein V5O48_002704 [Marasmius crinis-equi]|uniref:BHLH domain-containing protein n=1 Tax=Marasmius crinis-equi TaxID=585013 RepID=A0ABR3FVD0_9AGAR
MSDLLSPSESHELHSFLSAIDYGTSNDTRGTEWGPYTSEGITLPAPPQGSGREALTKATKDLMSLDSSPWGGSPSSSTSMNNYQQSHGPFHYNSQTNHSPQYDYKTSRNNSDGPIYLQQPQLHHRHGPSSPTNVTFPFLSKQSPPHPPLLSQSHSDPSNSLPTTHGQSIAPIHTMGSHQRARNNSEHQFDAIGSPVGASSSSSFSFSTSNNGAGAGATSSSAASSPSNSESLRAAASPESSNSSNKRPYESSYPPTNKRPRPSPTNGAGLAAKSTLLSPSQKKANHIQSEQKRRANIRRGYEALCETVPALREAIRQEEEAQQANAANGAKGPAKPKRGRGKGKVDEGTGEKIDGRAGPRSENIVLGKTIEYINDLLSDREALLSRLRNAKSSLGQDHPSCTTPDSSVPPLWERQWNGGSGKDADAEDEEDEEEE